MPLKHNTKAPADKSDAAHESKWNYSKIPDAALKFMLRNTSYYRVIDVVKGIASEKFGDIVRLLDNKEYYIHPAPDRSNTEELENDHGGLKAEKLKINLKIPVEINGDTMKKKFYYFPLNRCYEALRIKMESKELHNDKDLLELFNGLRNHALKVMSPRERSTERHMKKLTGQYANATKNPVLNIIRDSRTSLDRSCNVASRTLICSK